MKIFNVENGIKKVYVQMNDITMMNQTGIQIPASIFEKVLDDSNSMDFVEFIKPKEIEFFKSLDWIIDYKQVRCLSEEENEQKRQEIVQEMSEIVHRFNSMSEKEKRNNQLLLQRHRQLNYKMNYFTKILWVKQGSKQIPFPVVPDSDGYSFVGDGNCEYEIRASLDPNKILLFRKDGKKLSNDETIPQGFLQTGMSIAIMDRNEKNNFFENYGISSYLTDDHQYLVTEFRVKRYDYPQEERKAEKGIKRLVKRIFNKK